MADVSLIFSGNRRSYLYYILAKRIKKEIRSSVFKIPVQKNGINNYEPV